MALPKAKVEVELVDNVSSRARKVENSINNFADSTTKKMKNMAIGVGAAIASTFAVSKITAFMNESVEAYKESEQAEQKLTAAIGYRSQALIDNASAMQKVSLYDDEAVLGAQANIGMFIKEEETIKKVTKAAMNLATAKNMSLVSAADLVTKSIASSTNAMGRYGIQIEGVAGSTERAESAVNAIEKAFGGMSEAMANTDAGKIIQMQNAIGDTKEIIGKELLPLQLEWNKLALDLAEMYTGPIAEGLKTLSYILGGDEKVKSREKELKIIGQEIRELTKLKKVQDDIITLQTHRKNQGYWYDEEALIQAKNNSETILEQIKDLNNASNKASGLIKTPIIKTPVIKNTDIVSNSGDTLQKENALSEINLNSPMKKYFEELEKYKQEKKEAISRIESEIFTGNLSSDQFEAERIQIKAHYNELYELAEKYGQDTTLLKNQENKKLESINKMKVQSEIDTYKDIHNVMSNSLLDTIGQNKKFIGLYKTLTISQIIADTASASMAAYSSIMSNKLIPFPLNQIAAVGLSGTIAMAGAANISRVASIKQLASGDDFISKSGFYTVGEKGREQVWLNRGSQVVNNRETSYNESNSQSTTNVYNIYDQSGNITNTFTRQIRNGQAKEFDRYIEDKISKRR